MKLSKNIRTRLGQYRFMKDIRKSGQKREVVSFDEADKIGILYDATNEKDYETVKAYLKTVRANFKKDIHALGFVDKKNLPATQYAQFGLDFFSRKDLNFSMIPVNPIVDNFIKEKFDILINLNSGKCFPLRYISAMSHSRFRVGRYSRNHMICYDMMVQLKGEPPLKTVIEEIEHFLRLLKKA
jgi:hypothetical protein